MRNPFASVRPEDLKAIAREATSDHMQSGTELTDAVVKAASLFDGSLTTEHVRRVCEMAYHDTFERRFHEKAGSLDRLVSFNPPDAAEAAGRLRAEKVASVRSVQEASAVMGSDIMDKVASVSATSRRRHSPVNAFDELVKQAGAEDPSKVLWYNPLGEAVHIRDQIKESISELEVQRNGLSDSEKYAMFELAEHAYQAVKEGHGVSGVLHACVSSVELDKYADGVVPEVVDELVMRLASIGVSLESEKIASLGAVNPRHPLPQQFSKIAAWRNERVHIEYALSELQRDLDRVNGELRALCS